MLRYPTLSSAECSLPGSFYSREEKAIDALISFLYGMSICHQTDIVFSPIILLFPLHTAQGSF